MPASSPARSVFQRFALIAGAYLLNLASACGSPSEQERGLPSQAGIPGASDSQGGADITGSGSGSSGTSGASGVSGVSGVSVSVSGASGAASNTSEEGAAGRSPTSGGASGSAGAAADCTTPPVGSALVGWAWEAGMGVATTTGGGNATPETVSTLAALSSAVSGTAAKVIYVSGKLSAGKISVGSNKTIVGLCGAELHGHVAVSGSSNVIIRNLKIVGYGAGDCALDPDYDSAVGCSSGNDAVTVNNRAHHIWFDHCDISDGTDGNLDITQGADFVTVSWTKFHYTPRTDNTGSDSTGAYGHRFSNLIGAADNVAGDIGHLNVTWHHDWWADNVNQRMPRTRAGKIHLFNNLFTATGNSYCSNAGQGAALLVENSIYAGVKAPFQIGADALGLISSGNTFPDSTGTTTGSGSAFTPPYAYTLESTSDLQASLEANAGPQ